MAKKRKRRQSKVFRGMRHDPPASERWTKSFLIKMPASVFCIPRSREFRRLPHFIVLGASTSGARIKIALMANMMMHNIWMLRESLSSDLTRKICPVKARTMQTLQTCPFKLMKLQFRDVKPRRSIVRGIEIYRACAGEVPFKDDDNRLGSLGSEPRIEINLNGSSDLVLAAQRPPFMSISVITARLFRHPQQIIKVDRNRALYVGRLDWSEGVTSWLMTSPRHLSKWHLLVLVAARESHRESDRRMLVLVLRSRNLFSSYKTFCQRHTQRQHGNVKFLLPFTSSARRTHQRAQHDRESASFFECVGRSSPLLNFTSNGSWSVFAVRLQK